jgi:hypothetical protein
MPAPDARMNALRLYFLLTDVPFPKRGLAFELSDPEKQHAIQAEFLNLPLLSLDENE